MPAPELLIELNQDHVATVILARPHAANALNTSLAEALAAGITKLAADPAIRAIIITGQGDRAFCAGADLKERQGMSEAQWHEQHHAFEQALAAISACPVPIIAAVNGAAYGGGLELALACDFIYAAQTARFALTETSLGIIPGLAGTQRLPRAIGMAKAKELIYMAKPFSADEAVAWGMVNALHEPAQLLSATSEAAQRIAANAPLAVRAAKRAIEQGVHLKLSEAHQVELIHYNSLLDTADRHEGINAFNEKRKPHFSGK